MGLRVYRALAALVFALFTPIVYAQLDEDGRAFLFSILQAPEKQSSLQFSFSHASVDANYLSYYTQLLRLGNDDVIEVPHSQEYSRNNTDYLTADINWRYGLTQDTEIGVRMGATQIDERANFGSSIRRETSLSLNSLTASVSHTLSPEKDKPGVYGRLAVDLLQNRVAEGEKFEKLPGSGSLSLTAYRTLDPVVISLTVGSRFTPEYRLLSSDRRYDSGDVFYVVPSIVFAVNSWVSLSVDADLTVRQGDRLDGQLIRPRQSAMRFGGGFGFTSSQFTSIHIGGDFAATGPSEASMSISVRRNFGGKLKREQVEKLRRHLERASEQESSEKPTAPDTAPEPGTEPLSESE